MIEQYPILNRVEVFLNITNQIQMCTMWVCISARYWKVRLGSGLLTPQAQWCCYFFKGRFMWNSTNRPFHVYCNKGISLVAFFTCWFGSLTCISDRTQITVRTIMLVLRNIVTELWSPYKHKLQSFRHVILKPFWYFSISLMALFTT